MKQPKKERRKELQTPNVTQRNPSVPPCRMSHYKEGQKQEILKSYETVTAGIKAHRRETLWTSTLALLGVKTPWLITNLSPPCVFVLQWAGLLRLPQCKRSLPTDLWPVGRPGSPDPETQRGFAGERGRRRLRESGTRGLETESLGSIAVPPCFNTPRPSWGPDGAEIITHFGDESVLQAQWEAVKGLRFSGFLLFLRILEKLKILSWISELVLYF